MDPPVLFPASPGIPLFPLSPERVNGARPLYGLPQSPSLPEFRKPDIEFGKPTDFSVSPGSPVSPFRTFVHSRNSSSASDAHVQGMVARFNSLDIRDHKDKTGKYEIEYRRAEMARETAELEAKKMRQQLGEAEVELKRVREEGRKLKKEVDEGRERERKATKKLEVVTEDLHRTKDNHARTKPIYEQEVRHAKKEALKSSRHLIKVQEELQATRNSLRIAQAGLESERTKSSKREQEAFTAQYQLVGVQEELEKADARIKIAEAERDALKTSLKEEEVARIAAEGRIALPASNQDEDDEFASPKKAPVQRNRRDSEDKENMLPKPAVELKALQEELELERRLRDRAQEQVQFMKMECQFRCCSCRVAERHGSRYVHDDSLVVEMERIKLSIPQVITPPASEDGDERMEEEEEEEEEEETTDLAPGSAPTEVLITLEEPEQEDAPRTETQLSYSPTSGTFQRVPPPVEPAPPQPPAQQAQSAASAAAAPAPDARPSTGDQPAPAAPTARPATPTTLHDARPTASPSTPASAPPSTPQTPAPRTPPQHRAIRTVTTTTTVPLLFSPCPTAHAHAPGTAAAAAAAHPRTPAPTAHPPPQPARNARTDGAPSSSPSSSAIRVPRTAAPPPQPPFDRRAALEQIRARRGRARSLAAGCATPMRTGGLEGGAGAGPERRDISAPALRGWTTGGR